MLAGKLNANAHSQQSIDLSDNDTTPIIIITNYSGYEKIKSQYSSYPKSKKDISIYGFDGIRYCKVTSESEKKFNGVIMQNNDSPKFLSEIIFPNIEYDNVKIYITLEHYNLYNSFVTENLQIKCIEQDFHKLYENIDNYLNQKQNQNIQINFIMKSDLSKIYNKILENQSLINNNKIKIHTNNNVCQINYIFEIILGKIINGHIPMFNGFLSYGKNYEPLYVDTYSVKKENINNNLSILISMIMRTDTIQIQGNGECNFIIIFEKKDDSNYISITEQNLKCTLFETDNIDQMLDDQNKENNEHKQDKQNDEYKQLNLKINNLCSLIKFKQLINSINISNNEACKKFYIDNIQIITNYMFTSINTIIDINIINTTNNSIIYIINSLNNSIKKLLIFVKEKLCEIQQYYMNYNLNDMILNDNSTHQYNTVVDVDNSINFMNRQYSCK